MGKKKSAAQIRRMRGRAKARGEEYVYENDDGDDDDDENVDTKDEEVKVIKEIDPKVAIAQKLRASLKELEDNVSGMNAKERRAAKRKAEAIAIEEAMKVNEDSQAPITADDLLASIPDTPDDEAQSTSKKLDKHKGNSSEADASTGYSHASSVPYIVFVGQLSYSTTSDSLLEYLCSGLGLKDKKDRNRLSVRLLTHKDTGKSRGMAFVQVDTPDLLYECFKLHQTYLDGRRINVERTCGGRGNKNQAEKLLKYREEHKEYISSTVDQMIQEFIKNGQMEENELDEGAVALCKRHAMAIVEQTLTEYVESKTKRYDNDSNFENPSAYFTKILTRIAIESMPGVPVETDSKYKKNGDSKRRRKS